MSEKKAKLIRKLQKHSMENKAPAPQYSLQQLEQLIGLLQLLTGEKPVEIVLTESFYVWYTQEVQRHADTLGLKLGYRNDNPEFSGVRLLKKEKKVEVVKK